MNAWQWFLAHGDKLLVGLSASIAGLEANGVLPHSTAVTAAAVITAIAGVLHTIALPEPTKTP
jgi:hypothetical protein